eukprot:3111574-Pyramimonas_sp.AAC.2
MPVRLESRSPCPYTRRVDLRLYTWSLRPLQTCLAVRACTRTPGSSNACPHTRPCAPAAVHPQPSIRTPAAWHLYTHSLASVHPQPGICTPAT